MISEELLKTLGTACGLPELAFNDQDCAHLLLDGTISVQLENNPASDIIYMYSVLGKLPPDDCGLIYRQMLEDNLFGHATQNAVLAIDKMHGDILLWRTISARQTSGPEMVNIFETFVTIAEAWLEKLQALQLRSMGTETKAGMPAKSANKAIVPV